MTILVCEREPKTVDLIKRGLERCGHKVKAAYCEAEALRLVRTYWTDFVILDGDTIGLDVLRALRAVPWTADVPCVVLTARPDDAWIFSTYSAGADMVLTKPFDPQELVTFRPCD